METKLKLNLIFFGLEFDITRILSEVRVLLKLNIFLLPAMIAAYAAAGYIVWNQLSANVEQDVMETARLMLGGAGDAHLHHDTGGAAVRPGAG
jgi:hypothetical protein